MVRQIVYSLQSSTEVAHIRIIDVYAKTYERLMTQHQRRRTHVWCRGATPYKMRRKMIPSGFVLNSAVYMSNSVRFPYISQTVCVHTPATESKLGAPAFVI